MKLIDSEIKLDGIDKKILRSLIINARTPILEISKEIGVSAAAVHQRLRKLEKSNLIKGSHFIINEKALGFKTMAFIGIFLDKEGIKLTDVVTQLKKIPEVLECHYTTGNWSILTKILCRDNQNLMQILNKNIQSIRGVSRTETYISLDQQIDRQISI